MTFPTQLASPASLGGAGYQLEAHYQALFLILMLSGGRAPFLQPWPIVEVNLQGRVDGWATDDLVVTVQCSRTGQKARLLGQVKRTIAVTKSDESFKQFLQAAWHDFNNTTLFKREQDAIALMTGFLSRVDATTVPWLLEQAKVNPDVEVFLRNVSTASFSPTGAEKKLDVIRYHLAQANDGSMPSHDELYRFLQHLYIVSSDLGGEHGLDLSLLHSHILQYNNENPEWIWARAVEVVRNWGKDAGSFTRDNVPDDLTDVFDRTRLGQTQTRFVAPRRVKSTGWIGHAPLLAMLALAGGWSESNRADFELVSRVTARQEATLSDELRTIVNSEDSPLSVRGGVSQISNRQEILEELGGTIFERDLRRFGKCVVEVFSQPNPAFDMKPEERHLAQVKGKVSRHSSILRRNLAEGLALLGTRLDAFPRSRPSKVRAVAEHTVWNLLSEADWKLWGSLQRYLPSLAEAAPNTFLDILEAVLAKEQSPFDELIAQQGHGPWGSDYLMGVLWALEALAWDEAYLVRTCELLAQLVERASGYMWCGRPLESIATILLPWFPQTTASVEKRQVAIKMLANHYNDIAWEVVLRLLPNNKQVSNGTYKPRWRMTISDDFRPLVSAEEYWYQVHCYAGLALNMADGDAQRLVQITDAFARFGDEAGHLMDDLLGLLSESALLGLPDEQRLLLWDKLKRLALKHRQYAGAPWAMNEERLVELDAIVMRLAPKDPLAMHRPLFAGGALNLVDSSHGFVERMDHLKNLRQRAVEDIRAVGGMDAILKFVQTVESPLYVGETIAALDDYEVDRALLPSRLHVDDDAIQVFLGVYVLARFYKLGEDWIDQLSDGWAKQDLEKFLYILPFTEVVWERAARWLGEDEYRYWEKTSANPYQADGPLLPAVEKLQAHQRPVEALNCLYRMLQTNESFDPAQCAELLVMASTSNEQTLKLDPHQTVQLIGALQEHPTTPSDALMQVEWVYLKWLDGTYGVFPRHLHQRLSEDPEFFSSVIQILYRPDKPPSGDSAAQHGFDDAQIPESDPDEGGVDAGSGTTDEQRAQADNAWELLYGWALVPGTKDDGTFHPDIFTEWLSRVDKRCSDSGHLEPAFYKIGAMLTHTPPDPDGLWIHRTVAMALNGRRAHSMRSGYTTALFNARGVHVVTASGDPERRLAEKYRERAEHAENAGYHRLAAALRGVGEQYDRDAERITSRYQH